MYYCGQIVHNLDTGKPCRVGDKSDGSAFAYSNLPLRTTHYIRSNPHFPLHGPLPKTGEDFINLNGQVYWKDPKRQYVQEYEVFTPRTLKEAKELLRKGIITPAPCSVTHHWRCRNWLSNHERGSCTCTMKQREEDDQDAVLHT